MIYSCEKIKVYCAYLYGEEWFLCAEIFFDFLEDDLRLDFLFFQRFYIWVVHIIITEILNNF